MAEVPRVDINQLNRNGVLCGYHRGTLGWPNAAPDIAVSFTTDAGRIEFVVHQPGCSFAQTVRVDWEACRFGGKRPFFVCPHCNGRSLHLYHLGHLACRKCHKLSYPSQRERESDRAQRRANRLRLKLGGEPGWHNIPPRPKGMHQSTYDLMIESIVMADAQTDSYINGGKRK